MPFEGQSLCGGPDVSRRPSEQAHFAQNNVMVIVVACTGSCCTGPTDGALEADLNNKALCLSKTHTSGVAKYVFDW